MENKLAPLKKSLKQIKVSWDRAARRNVSSWMDFIPAHLTNQMIRSSITVPTTSGDLVVKIAETSQEIASAFRLLHASYVDAGLMRPTTLKMRVTKYHLLPTTTVIIAQLGEKTVGTLSIVQDGAFGLPIDKLCPRRLLFPAAHRAAEISAIALAREYRKEPGKVLFPLTKFMWEYTDKHLGLDYLFAAVNPKHALFYEAILLFKRIRFSMSEYDFVNGRPALGEFLDLKSAHAKYQKVYGSQEASRNLYRYYTEVQHDVFQFPVSEFPRAFHGGIDPSLCRLFFAGESPLVKLDDYELELLSQLFKDSEMKEYLPQPRVLGRVPVRSEPRYPVYCAGTLTIGRGKIVPLKIVEASEHGLKAIAPSPLRLGTSGVCTMGLGHGLSAELKVKLIRTCEPGAYGFHVDLSSREWSKMVGTMNYYNSKLY